MELQNAVQEEGLSINPELLDQVIGSKLITAFNKMDVMYMTHLHRICRLQHTAYAVPEQFFIINPLYILKLELEKARGNHSENFFPKTPL